MSVRIQRRRTAGWRMPDGAVYVGRPTIWGNPFKIDDPIERDSPLAAFVHIPGGWGSLASVTMLTAAQAVDAYFEWIVNNPPLWLRARDELAGHDLACWCDLAAPCHADVLLDVASS